MPLSKEVKQTIVIPEGVQFEVDKKTYTFKGPRGEVKKILFSPIVQISKEENKIVLNSNVLKPTKREKCMINTFKSHIKNLIKGVQEGFTYKLKICSSHFPMTVTADKEKLTVKNFLGEKVPRVAKIVDGSTVKIDGEDITVESPDVEKAGQTAANIEKSTRITNKDRRKFQDGIYITEKAGKKI